MIVLSGNIEILRSFAQKIDIRRFGGLGSVLGVDIDERRAHIIELSRRGGYFNEYRASYEPVRWFTAHFDENQSIQERAELLKKALVSNEVKVRSAAASIAPSAVKTFRASVPAGTEDIDEWIADNLERLVRIPISIQQIWYRYEILGSTASGIELEVTIVRRDEIERVEAVLESAGCDLIAIGSAVRDLSLAISLAQDIEAETTLAYFFGQTLVLSTVNGERRITKVLSLPGADEELVCLRQDRNVLSAGEKIPHNLIDMEFRPLGIPTEYTLALGLALKGFVPEISPMNFLGQKGCEKTETKLSRTLALRLSIACGGVLMLMLLILTLLDAVLNYKLDKASEELYSAGPVLREVTSLEKEISAMEEMYGTTEQAYARSDAARVLHSVAGALPDSVWLYSIILDNPQGGNISVTLSGFALGELKVTEALHALEIGRAGSQAQLIRMGTPLDGEPLPAGRGFVTFQIQLTLNQQAGQS